MQGKIALEEHFAIEPTLGDSQDFGAHVWKDLRHRLLDIHDTRLGEMDKYGIEMMILSLNAPAIQAIHDVKNAIAVARQANDVLAGEVRKRPDRFAAFAALPMQDPDAAITELARWTGAHPRSLYCTRRGARSGRRRCLPLRLLPREDRIRPGAAGCSLCGAASR